MDKDTLLTLGAYQHESIELLYNGRFFWRQLLKGAWLAVYTPLDGALLLTSDPPAGFIGLNESDMQIGDQNTPQCIHYPNLAGLDCWLDLKSDEPLLPDLRDESLKISFHLAIKVQNKTHNPLPVGIAFSWQDLEENPFRKVLVNRQQAVIQFGSGLQLQAVCSSPQNRYTYCCGWNPEGDGAEIWDDFFAFGELGNQKYEFFASALGGYNLLASQAELQMTFCLSM